MEGWEDLWGGGKGRGGEGDAGFEGFVVGFVCFGYSGI